ncbi:MAG: adenylate/guanylate cyclase domain-containing protein [Chryseolinea sp.]
MSTHDRHLAAILFTDIVGYTAMMQKDESKAVVSIKHYHEVLEKSIATHRGEILNNYGDGSLCSFSSVLEALNCAIELQRNLQSEPVVPLRIGLHVGEIFFENGKVLGDGINVASRIQSLGTSNSILFSSEINNKVKNQPGLKTLSLGSFHFKNVDDRMEVFALVNDGFTVPERKKMEGKLEAAGQKTIAVLPFENMCNDPDQEYFSDGLTEEIIADLSKLSSLHVISRTSVMAFKGTKKDVTTIGEELNVRYVLEGSVRKTGNKLRITAQLIDAPNDAHLWADKFNGVVDDVFEIQEKVSHSIVDALRLELTPNERARMVVKSTPDRKAHELYLEGRYHLNQVTPAEIITSISLFEKAINIEPHYALAHASLACAYNYLAWLGGVAGDLYPKAKQAALRALDIDDSLAEAHAVLGYAATFYDWDWALAEREIKCAIAYNPNYAAGYLYYSWYLGSQWRLEEARAAIVRASELDPLALIIHANMGNYYQWKRDYDEALAQTQRILDLAPDLPLALLFSGMAHWGKGQYKEAAVGFARMVELAGSGFKGYLGYSYAKAGLTDKALMVLAEMTEQSKTDAVPSFQFFLVLLGLDRVDEALTWLEQAFEERAGGYFPYLRQESVFDPLRDEPRFQELVRRLNFPD